MVNMVMLGLLPSFEWSCTKIQCGATQSSSTVVRCPYVRHASLQHGRCHAILARGGLSQRLEIFKAVLCVGCKS